MRKALLACAVFVLATADARAAFQITYSFTGLAGNQVSTPATTPAAGITAGAIVRGSGLGANAGGGSMNSNNWTTSTTLDPDDYYGFTLTADSGTTFDLTTLAYGDQRSNTGPTVFAIRTSLDNFADDAFSYSNTTVNTVTNRSFQFDDPVFSGLFTNLSTIEIRIYGYGNTVNGGTGGTFRLNNGTTAGGEVPPGGLVVKGDLNTSTNVVPAPASALLFAFGAPALFLVRRRRAA